MSETPQEAAVRISRLPFLEQFQSHQVASIETEPLITGIGMLGHITGDGNFLRWFRIVIESKLTHNEWPGVVSHELGHACHFTLRNGLYLARTRWTLREEEFCDAFAEAWLQLGTNRQELDTILAGITPEKPFVLIPEGYTRIYRPRATS